jgi:hypothetical protein
MTMEEQQPAKSGFFTTMPGMLTAVAAVITAIGGVYGVYAMQNDGDQPPPPAATSPPAEEPPEEPTTPAPSEPTYVPIIIALDDLYGDASTDTAAVSDPFVAWYMSADLDRQAVADACGNGDLDSCAVLEQVLAQDCGDTSDAACDVLYFFEPQGSELEDLGATCGYLFEDWSFAGRCST